MNLAHHPNPIHLDIAQKGIERPFSEPLQCLVPIGCQDGFEPGIVVI